MPDEAGYPNGTGSLPGDRRRRRRPLPGAEGAQPNTPPIGSRLATTTPAPKDDSLAVTEKPKVAPSVVLALRMSEQHHHTADMMLDVLATRYRIDKRQAAELVVQFLVDNRFDLFDYVGAVVGPSPIDMDFFTPPVQQLDPVHAQDLTDDDPQQDTADDTQ